MRDGSFEYVTKFEENLFGSNDLKVYNFYFVKFNII